MKSHTQACEQAHTLTQGPLTEFVVFLLRLFCENGWTDYYAYSWLCSCLRERGIELQNNKEGIEKEQARKSEKDVALFPTSHISYHNTRMGKT